MLHLDLDLEYDTELWSDQMAVEMADGFEWKGYWLIGHMILWAAAQLKGQLGHFELEDSALKVKRVRIGAVPNRIYEALAQGIKKQFGEPSVPAEETVPSA